MVNVSTPKGGVHFNEKGDPVQMKGMEHYMQSKAGELLLAHEFDRRIGSQGVVSVVSDKSNILCAKCNADRWQSVNPGLMKTGLQRHSPPPQRLISVGDVYPYLL